MSTTACVQDWPSEMAGAVDSYSRLVAWAKVALPLAALALLSMLFLLAKPQNTDVSLPFAEVELEDMITFEQIGEPSFSGVLDDGTSIILNAETVGNMRDGRPGTQAQGLSAILSFSTGDQLKIIAPLGEIDESQDIARLQGGVTLNHSDGTELRTEAITSALNSTLVASVGEIVSEGPFGEIVAGQMVLKPNAANQNELHFKNGVQMLYLPKLSE